MLTNFAKGFIKVDWQGPELGSEYNRIKSLKKSCSRSCLEEWKLSQRRIPQVLRNQIKDNKDTTIFFIPHFRDLIFKYFLMIIF